MIHPTSTQAVPVAPAALPVRAAAAYLRRPAGHVIVTALPDVVVLSFGDLCPELPGEPAIEMFASLTLTRAFAQSLVDLLQQQLRQPVPQAPPGRP